MSTETILPQAATLTAKDFATDQEVRWCPGCGDYSILAQVQKVMPTIGVPKENIVIISGIGCSSRFPYYMNTFGMHSIHGRATAIASGLKAARPELSVWIVAGDGDALSIGGNHTIHMLRRNFDVNLQTMITRAQQHKGSSFLEIYQNCNIFNDGAFEVFTEKASKPLHALFVEQGKPLTFGANNEMGIRFDGLRPEVVTLGDKYSADDLWIHDEKDFYKAQVLVRLFDNPSEVAAYFPRPFGVFYTADRPCYEDMMALQVEEAMTSKGMGDLDKLIRGKETWEIL